MGATPVDLATLKANGYADLAARLEIAGALGLESGKKGLVALKKVLASGMTDLAALTEANQIAQEASDIGIKALNALPRPESLKPGTIENLRALGLSNLATSLEGVGNSLQDSSRICQTAHLMTRGLGLPFLTLLLQAGLITTPTCLVTLVMVTHTTDKANTKYFSTQPRLVTFITLHPTFNAGHLKDSTVETTKVQLKYSLWRL